MKSALLGIVSVLSICLGGIASASPNPRAQLTGHFIYERNGPHAAVVEITVNPGPNGKLSVEVSAAHPDAHGAAPDGGGEGQIGTDGILRFPYEDSFSNHGSGTFERTKPNRYRLVIDIRDVQDSRCMTFYGDMAMKRIKP